MTTSVDPPATQPTTWWQWFLIYPALGIALFSAIPNWAQSAEAWYEGLSDSNALHHARRQHQLFRANLKCMTAPFEYKSTVDSIKVDGTICESTGDIMLRVSASTINYKNFPKDGYVLFVGINDIMEFAGDQKNRVVSSLMSAHASTRQDVSEELAAELPGYSTSKPIPKQTKLAQQFAVVICQKFQADNRILLRHLRVGKQCVDEKVDTFTGAVVSRANVSCRSSC